MRRILLTATFLLTLLTYAKGNASVSERAPFLNNAYGRDAISLNGGWNALIDMYDRGERMKFPLELKPEGKTDFVEYSFDGAMTLNVPGDWNSQTPELRYYEGTVWYARHFDAEKLPGTRYFLYFAGVSNRCKVFLNGECVADHEGAFLPFQAEVTASLKDGDNFISVKVDNTRREDAIPALDFDWWNYGGITRDVMLIRTPPVYVNDWFISLDKRDRHRINVYAELSEEGEREIEVSIPELGLCRKVTTGADGRTSFNFKAEEIAYWSPSSPKLYSVSLSCEGSTVTDEIGFRTITTDGTKILLNGEPFFAKSVSFHEEMPMREGRACTEEDAAYLLGEVRSLGANMVRLAHYPQNEHIVRLAEKMGIVLWEEIPLWQKIKFTDDGTLAKATSMYRDMLIRDRNRCAICFWGLANETRPSEARNSFLKSIQTEARTLDTTRLFTLADDIANYNPQTCTVEMDDPFIENVDVVAINKYLGWYAKWPSAPQDMKWNVAPGKPLIISEFGGEALYGRHGAADTASSWSEEYQATLYRDNLRTFSNIENLAGISPWVLFDFRSPRRFLPGLQDGWNRKGLISDKGERKMSWQIMHDYYTGQTDAQRSSSGVLSGIVPAPLEATAGDGTFKVSGARVLCDRSLDGKTAAAVAKFAGTLSTTSGSKSRFAVRTGLSKRVDKGVVRGIVFVPDSTLAAEEYRIGVSKKSVVVKASERAGFLYAIQTIKQMLPVAVYGKTASKEEDWTLPCCTVSDRPRYGYRGLLLDCGRHFIQVEDIRRYLDIMAVYKYNVLHWHLTEDQGWRIEIKKYPRLTEVGAYRDGTQIGKDRSSSDGVRYGGYYTQEQIRGIVEYADELGITVVPEIDIPGHTQAILASYPELGSECSEPLPYKVMTHWGVSKQVLNVGKDETIKFLEDVFDEAAELFPGEYFCIGGDECPKGEWEKDPFCQAKIKELGLVSDDKVSAEQRLQNHVMAHMMKYLTAKGKKVLGADDLIDGDYVEDGITIMSWRGTKRGIIAANRGIDVLMVPTSHCFLDYYQLEDTDRQPLAIGNYLPLSKAYSFDPSEGLDSEAAAHIKGVQAQMWTEYVATPEHIEYMMFPRMFALSEVQWCSAGNKDYDRFVHSVDCHQTEILETMGYNYCKEHE